MVLNTYWLIQVLTIITKIAFHSLNFLSLPFMFFVFVFPQPNLQNLTTLSSNKTETLAISMPRMFRPPQPPQAWGRSLHETVPPPSKSAPRVQGYPCSRGGPAASLP